MSTNKNINIFKRCDCFISSARIATKLWVGLTGNPFLLVAGVRAFAVSSASTPVLGTTLHLSHCVNEPGRLANRSSIQ
jgi:hypothetical protein